MRPIMINSSDLERVQWAASIIEQSMRAPLTIKRLAAKVKLSEVKLKLAFKQVYGVGPYGYLLEVRMKKAKLLLLEGEAIKVIIMTIGYRTESSFCKAFRKAFKDSPKAWTKKTVTTNRLSNLQL